MSSNIQFKSRIKDYSEIDLKTKKSNSETIQFNSFGQIISRARFEKKPLIVVEGYDDVPIYEVFLKKADLDMSVRAIETFSGYGEGCENVKKFIRNAQKEINKSPENEKFILGIVDRDASVYRGEDLSTLKCIFMLDVYSFESHFVTNNHAKYVLENLLNGKFIINNDIVVYVMENFKSILETFYYLSLEALKNACLKEYEGEIGYSYTFGQIKNIQEKVNKVVGKKEELIHFALEKGLSLEYFKLVIKGKWLLEAFVENIHSKVCELIEACISDKVINGQQRCQFCASGIYEKCSWKIRKYYNKNTINNLILQYICETETGYITNRLRLLG